MDAGVLLPIIINIILDDVGRKLVKLDGLVNIIDKTTDFASSINDKIVSKVSSIVYKVFKKRKEKNKDE